MPLVKTVVARMHTPADPDTGERSRIIMETTSDHVYDPDTGETIQELINANKHGTASETEPGLMTSDQVKNINLLMENVNVFSTENPGKACMWYQIQSEE